MAEPMGKLKSNLLLFALALGEQRRAGQPPPSGRHSCRTGGRSEAGPLRHRLRGQVLVLPGGPLGPQNRGAEGCTPSFFPYWQKESRALPRHSLRVVCSADAGGGDWY